MNFDHAGISVSSSAVISGCRKKGLNDEKMAKSKIPNGG